MTFFWGDDGMFDLKGEDMFGISDEVFEFIEETLDKLESVLVHSSRGQSRASAVIDKRNLLLIYIHDEEV